VRTHPFPLIPSLGGEGKFSQSRLHTLIVMPGLDPGIHVLLKTLAGGGGMRWGWIGSGRR